MRNIDDRIKFEPSGFDYVNPGAKVVIVGITPGNNQLKDSREGLSPKEIKRRNAFCGNMRPNLIRMLDYVGVNHLLGIKSCQTLWDEDFDKVEMTSLLKDATYIYQENTGQWKMFNNLNLIDKSQKLQNMLESRFVKNCESYKCAKLFIGLGPGVYDVLIKLKERGVIQADIIGIAHPSGANGGRIACYLGEREPNDSSYEWCRHMALKAIEICKSI